ncbi:hypothetical protein EELLY_v1c05030 [Entomoplasma ellychniae]|uniref:Uncharacterized protein n=1 Tax=Entomoplasma ellychniae TaxID=2114 RepID=A0A8E2QW78_9MOLU|nr:energy-coupled thiamine transporter ThiT [Entomoplasma ellychniae]PPE04822.1 hypothetical protein EELLY_v1c05030 [Entomoplasma ellychniae]
MERHFFYKVKKIRVKDITTMGIMLALYLVLNVMIGYSFGGLYFTINIQFIPIFIMAVYTDWLRTLIVAMIGSVIAFFLPANLDAGNIPAYLFDYAIPLWIIAVCSLFMPREIKNIVKYSSFYDKRIGKIWGSIKYSFIWIWRQKGFVIGIFVFVVLFFISKSIGGVLFWRGDRPINFQLFIWAGGVNLPNSIIDLILLGILIPLVCNILQPIKKQIY